MSWAIIRNNHPGEQGQTIYIIWYFTEHNVIFMWVSVCITPLDIHFDKKSIHLHCPKLAGLFWRHHSELKCEYTSWVQTGVVKGVIKWEIKWYHQKAMLTDKDNPSNSYLMGATTCLDSCKSGDSWWCCTIIFYFHPYGKDNPGGNSVGLT